MRKRTKEYITHLEYRIAQLEHALQNLTEAFYSGGDGQTVAQKDVERIMGRIWRYKDQTESISEVVKNARQTDD